MSKKKIDYWDEVDALYDSLYDEAKNELLPEYKQLFDTLEVELLALLLEYK